MSAEIYLIVAVLLSEAVIISLVKGFEYWQGFRKTNKDTSIDL